MRDIHVQGMLGLGDNIHQRAVIRQLIESSVVYLETTWPSVYHDMVGDRLKLIKRETQLRTQAKNAKREGDKFIKSAPRYGARSMRIWYSHDQIKREGSFLGAMCKNSSLPKGDFSLPIPKEWDDLAQGWIDKWNPDKPLMIYRPLVERTEWNGCASRNPDKQAYHNIVSAVREQFFVVSIADLVPGVEWESGIPIKADVECHSGELPFEVLAALFKRAGLVYCSPGFSLVLSQAVGAKVCCVFGGHESARFYDHKIPNNLLIQPDKPCECFNKTHKCDKTINVDLAIQTIKAFSNDQAQS